MRRKTDGREVAMARNTDGPCGRDGHNRGSEAPCGRGASVETEPYPRYPLLYIRYIITVLYEHGREGPDQRPLPARTKTRLPR